MARSLVIVESPAKAKTINKYLGRNFLVKASIGHVMDLPTKTIGIRLPGEEEGNGKKKKKKSKAKKGSKKAAKEKEKPVGKIIKLSDEDIFEPTLKIIHGKGKVINGLRKAASTADAVSLAGDPDREGEAISAHLAMVLSKPSKFLIDEEAEAEAEAKNAKKYGKKVEEPAVEKLVVGGKGKPAKKDKPKDEINIEPI